ncbi:uncharacterized protein LOC122471244 [Prionailurus bengalensis]|uniref:uncharacterized protein LOC122471244 n=1 Tax=Prionailurus bengalensis TaxID=37029 RepID=UPI001CA850B3|nr:uncharacterized protein LOC122471244 [Prionailurus bengalensis]
MSHHHPSPQTAFPVGTSVPSLCQLLGERDLERSPASATGSGSPGRIWGLKAPVFQVPGLATRELPARAPRKPGEAAPGTSILAIPLVLRLAQPRFGAEPRFSQPSQEGSRPSRKTKDAAPKPERGRDKSAGWAEPGLKQQARPGGSRRVSAPPPALAAFPGPGRVFHSTVCLGEVGDVLGAQGAGYGHKSSCGTSFPSLTRQCSWPPWHPGLHWAPCFPRHGLGFPGAARGVKAGASPFAKEREQPRPVLCHRLPSPRLLDPEAARASLDLRLGGAGNKPSGGYLASAEQSRPRARSGTITSKWSLLFARDFGGDR